MQTKPASAPRVVTSAGQNGAFSGRPHPAEATGGWTERRRAGERGTVSVLSWINAMKTFPIHVVTTNLAHLPRGDLGAFLLETPTTSGLAPRGALKFKSTSYSRGIGEILFLNFQTWFFARRKC